MSKVMRTDYLQGVNTVDGFLDAVSTMVEDFILEKGICPERLLIPDPKWFLVDMALYRSIHHLSVRVRRLIREKGSGHCKQLPK